VLQQDPPPAVTLDQGPTAVRATAGTMGLGPPVRRSITAPLGTIPAQLLGRPAITLARERTHVLASRGTLETGKPAHSSTTAPEPEEERMTAPAKPTAIPPVPQHSVVPAKLITPEME